MEVCMDLIKSHIVDKKRMIRRLISCGKLKSVGITRNAKYLLAK